MSEKSSLFTVFSAGPPKRARTEAHLCLTEVVQFELKLHHFLLDKQEAGVMNSG